MVWKLLLAVMKNELQAQFSNCACDPVCVQLKIGFVIDRELHILLSFARLIKGEIHFKPFQELVKWLAWKKFGW